MLAPASHLAGLTLRCRITRTGLWLAALWLALALMLSSAMAQTAGPLVQTEQVRAELLAHAPAGVQPGQRFWLGLRLQHQPHWHTYWQNPGDSGLPTQLQWQLPAGLQAGDVAWPLPKKIPIGMLANYGYEGTVLLPVPVTVGPDFKAPVAGPLKITLHAQWLVCRQECIPQEGQFILNLPVQSGTALYGDDFEAARKLSPQMLPRQQQSGTWISGGQTVLSEDGRQLQLRVHGLPVSWRGQTLSAFPVTANVVHNAATQGGGWTQNWQGAVWNATIPVSEERSDQPRTMRWVIALGPESSPQAPAFETETPVQGAWPALAAAPGVSPELAEALTRNTGQPPAAPAASTTALGMGLAVLGALLGGLLLNLMPCVFPVLAIKVLGFAQASHRREHRAAGLAYTAGVVLSFLLLGALMLGLRAAGEQLGWGFQLQSPPVVIALAILFTLLALNLAGLFEFGTWVPGRLAAHQSRHTTLNAGLSGVLAVAVASPCTAPFMGASLGLAVTLPPLQALAVFMAMGLGMASPFLAASLWPAWTERLPRPGPWMGVFRQVMAFPMLATVLWLVWVLGQQTGVDGAAALLATLLALAFALWALGLQGRARAVLGALALASLAGIAVQVLPLAWTEPAREQLSPGGRWRPWSEAEVQALQAAGRPVFVDFTAAWCVTCQYNKKTVLADPQVLAAFDAHRVGTLRADWTRRDAAITRALAGLGRNGVPVYAIYRPGRPPRVLSELPSRQEIEDALR